MKCEITWLYREVNDAGDCIADDVVGSINRINTKTWAEARAWIEGQIQKRESPRPPRRSPYRDHSHLELDTVTLDEISKFWDEDGEPQETKRVAHYEHGLREWFWTEEEIR